MNCQELKVKHKYKYLVLVEIECAFLFDGDLIANSVKQALIKEGKNQDKIKVLSADSFPPSTTIAVLERMLNK